MNTNHIISQIISAEYVYINHSVYNISLALYISNYMRIDFLSLNILYIQT